MVLLGEEEQCDDWALKIRSLIADTRFRQKLLYVFNLNAPKPIPEKTILAVKNIVKNIPFFLDP